MSVAPDAAFDIDRDGGMFGEDLTAAGSYFQATAASELGDSAAGLLTRRPAPICAFVIRNVGGRLRRLLAGTTRRLDRHREGVHGPRTR